MLGARVGHWDMGLVGGPACVFACVWIAHVVQRVCVACVRVVVSALECVYAYVSIGSVSCCVVLRGACILALEIVLLNQNLKTAAKIHTLALSACR